VLRRIKLTRLVIELAQHQHNVETIVKVDLLLDCHLLSLY
jgi:hypothetical protein